MESKNKGRDLDKIARLEENLMLMFETGSVYNLKECWLSHVKQ